MTSMQTGMYYPIDLEALPVGWEKGYVGDFALEIQPGFASGKHNKEGRGIPHIRPYNIGRSGKLDLAEIKSVDPEADTKRLHSGDVLFNNTNSPELIGKTTVITATDDWGFSNHMTRVAFPDAVSPKFAAYQLHYLWSRGYFLHNCVKHVNQASISSTTFSRTVPFVKPPRPQQDSIVAEIEKQFSRLDEAVANIKRIKANLKRYKAAVLKAAVEGKLTEDWRKQHPNVEPASKLLERILAERRAKWNGRGKYKEPSVPDTASLPSLPPCWVWVSPAQLSSADTHSLAIGPFGSNLKVSDYTDSGIPLIFVRTIRSLDFGDERRVYVSTRKAAELKAHRVSGGDVLVTKMGAPPGDACLYPEQAPDAIITADCIKLRLSRMLPEKRFIVHAINAEVVKSQVLAITKGVAQMKVSLARFGGIGIPLPTLAEQQQIVGEVERRLSVIEELEATVEANLTRADRLRQSVLSRAFSGQLVTAKDSCVS